MMPRCYQEGQCSAECLGYAPLGVDGMAIGGPDNDSDDENDNVDQLPDSERWLLTTSVSSRCIAGRDVVAVPHLVSLSGLMSRWLGNGPQPSHQACRISSSSSSAFSSFSTLLTLDTFRHAIQSI